MLSPPQLLSFACATGNTRAPSDMNNDLPLSSDFDAAISLPQLWCKSSREGTDRESFDWLVHQMVLLYNLYSNELGPPSRAASASRLCSLVPRAMQSLARDTLLVGCQCTSRHDSIKVTFDNLHRWRKPVVRFPFAFPPSLSPSLLPSY